MTLLNPMQKYRALRAKFADDRGVAAIEFALLAPFLFIMFFGLVDLTSYISLSRKATSSSAVLGDLVAQNSAAFTKASINDYFGAVNMIHSDLETSKIRAEVQIYRMSPTNVVTLMSTVSNGSGSSCTRTVNTAPFSQLMSSGNDLIVARVCITYAPKFLDYSGVSYIGGGNFKIEETTITRPRAKDRVPCTDC
jgi:Flp pilus assembly protein TadG